MHDAGEIYRPSPLCPRWRSRQVVLRHALDHGKYMYKGSSVILRRTRTQKSHHIHMFMSSKQPCLGQSDQARKLQCSGSSKQETLGGTVSGHGAGAAGPCLQASPRQE